MRNERTSKMLASLSGLILRAKKIGSLKLTDEHGMDVIVSGVRIRSLAASALTQAPDKPQARWTEALHRQITTTHKQQMAAVRARRGKGAKPLPGWKRRVDLRTRPKKSKS